MINPYSGDTPSRLRPPVDPSMPSPGSPAGQMPRSVQSHPNCMRRVNRAEPVTECAMPDVDDAIAWDFLTLVDVVEPLRFAAFCSLVAVVLLVRSRTARCRRPGGRGFTDRAPGRAHSLCPGTPGVGHFWSKNF